MSGGSGQIVGKGQEKEQERGLPSGLSLPIPPPRVWPPSSSEHVELRGTPLRPGGTRADPVLASVQVLLCYYGQKSLNPQWVLIKNYSCLVIKESVKIRG